MLKYIRDFFADIKTDLFHSSLLLSGSVIAQLIAFVAYPVLTRLYSPDQFGNFSVFLSITGILSIIATGRFEYALMIPKEDKKAIELKKIGLWWCMVFSAVCFMITLFIGISNKLSSRIPGLYFIAIYVFLTGSTQIFTLYQNRLKRYKKLAHVSIIQNTTASGAKVLFGFTGMLNLGLIVGSVAGQIASFITVSKGFLEKSIFRKPTEIKKTLKDYVAFPKYRMVQALINSLSSNMPIFFITYYFSAREAGFFGLILGLGYKVITIISSSLYQVLYRRFSDQKNHQKPILPLFLKILFLLAFVSIIPAIPVFFLSKYLITMFFGTEWIEAANYLQIMIPWLVLVFITMPFAFIADVLSLQKKVLLIDILHLLARIIGLYIGLWWNNVYLSVMLYSLISISFLLFILGWYYFVIRKEQKIITQN